LISPELLVIPSHSHESIIIPIVFYFFFLSFPLFNLFSAAFSHFTLVVSRLTRVILFFLGSNDLFHPSYRELPGLYLIFFSLFVSNDLFHPSYRGYLGNIVFVGVKLSFLPFISEVTWVIFHFFLSFGVK
jgi:hypothetical protein